VESLKNENLISAYWATIKRLNLLPNWWMSEEYINKSGLAWTEEDSFSGFKLPNESEWFFPPMKSDNGFVYCVNIYSGFLSNVICNDNKLLDLQFIYYPRDFLILEGHKWRVFRKNIRKYPKRYSEHLVYKRIKGTQNLNAIKELLLLWAKGREIFDNEIMIKFILDGKYRWGLFNDGRLVGMNVWDENFTFINYRYCIDDGTPFLNEYLRYCFYTHPTILLINKYVNDGGCLDSEGLKKFKMKLNPIKVYKVFSYKRTIG